jgi:hypothetical protein
MRKYDIADRRENKIDLMATVMPRPDMTLSVALLTGYAIHAHTLLYPLLQLKLFSIRTFRAAVSGSLFTRLGIGGVPFLLPLLISGGASLRARMVAAT